MEPSWVLTSTLGGVDVPAAQGCNTVQPVGIEPRTSGMLSQMLESDALPLPHHAPIQRLSVYDNFLVCFSLCCCLSCLSL